MPPGWASPGGQGGKQAGRVGGRTPQPSEDAEVSQTWAPWSRSLGAYDIRRRTIQTLCDAPRPRAPPQPQTPS